MDTMQLQLHESLVRRATNNPKKRTHQVRTVRPLEIVEPPRSENPLRRDRRPRAMAR